MAGRNGKTKTAKRWMKLVEGKGEKMSDKEALSRIKIDNLLVASGWRLLDDGEIKRNVVLEQGYRVGKTTKFTDYLLLDTFNRPLAVIEAKKVAFPLKSAKAQAMEYCRQLKVNYFYLSNGEEHYVASVNDGVLHSVEEFLTQEELIELTRAQTDRVELWKRNCEDTILADIKIPNVKLHAKFIDISTRKEFLSNQRIKLLRDYQVDAVNAIINSAKNGNSRFLLEMATGTGKTLTCAAIIEMFLSSKNAHRVLFLVDRIELEKQAKRAFDGVFNYGQHYTVSIYKEGRDNWRSAHIMITTVQSLLAQERYKTDFLPSDFDLIIVDEAHRTISGKARDVFEYFVGYKIGLTATPKDYFRGVNINQLVSTDIYEYDARAFRDTYLTFGCYSGKPTYEFTLSDGVKKGILVQPYAIDARTDISYQLLDEGLNISMPQESTEGDEDKKTEALYTSRDFEKKLFSETTNEMFCRMFLENAKRDPLTGEIGKTIIFCVSQNHAGKISNMLNALIKEYEPEKWTRYNGSFAVQVTSSVPDNDKITQLFTTDFNELNGTSTYVDGINDDDYKTSKTRVCCTVAMMTTGYDCQDLLNICLMRPVLQPSEFIQIKGRGTRIFEFVLKDKKANKEDFYFFDYFGNFERFEHYDYDKKIKAPKKVSEGGNPPSDYGGSQNRGKDTVTLHTPDGVAMFVGAKVGPDGMTIDREFNKGTSIRDAMLADNELKTAVDQKDWNRVIKIVNERYNNKPQFGFENNETIGKSMSLQRIPSWEELVELFYGIKSKLKTKEELLQETVNKCMQVFQIQEVKKRELRKLIEAYIESKEIRTYIEENKFMMFDYTGIYSVRELLSLGENAITIAKNIKTYIPEELLRSA